MPCAPTRVIPQLFVIFEVTQKSSKAASPDTNWYFPTKRSIFSEDLTEVISSSQRTKSGFGVRLLSDDLERLDSERIWRQ
ncbi:hypothetical protein CEXT_151881 [Caerostris extrusa]|uniref:Uncharacterized protein n=1 Tax=Caerostris extrusa TaxID=172846 RepID=A0AAV4UK10_CAEEX|nr:hypothetical protein CEXT_151881 [Caerostris extrusa]